MKEAKKHIASIVRDKVLNRFLIQVCINGLSVSVLILSLLYISNADLLLPLLFLIFVFVVTLARSYKTKKEALSDAQILRNFNALFSEMEHSSQLFMLEASEMNDLEKVQFEKIKHLPDKIVANYQSPIKTKRSLIFLGFSVVVSLVLIFFLKSNSGSSQIDSDQTSVSGSGIISDHLNEFSPPEIIGSKMIIRSPGYMNKPVREAGLENLEVFESSLIKLEIDFNKDVDFLNIRINNQLIQMEKMDLHRYGKTFIIRNSGVFQLEYGLDTLSYLSDAYKIDVKYDQPPEIGVLGMETYLIMEQAYQDPKLEMKIHDDFGLMDAAIIATITKGEGESVKFREEKLMFEDFKPKSKEYISNYSLDLKKLGMEPGDELYFYVAAVDNRMPEASTSRSETFFIVMPDSTNEVITMTAGLGVDLMPEYFRSQRQIIIDTEKLIKKRGVISKQEFDNESNSLAYDQKQLRLRYGQFLGEESESALDVQSNDIELLEEEDDVSDEGILKRFGHAHDLQEASERGVLDVEDKHGHDHNDGHDHGNNKKPGEEGETADDILEEFTHSHDSEENATLFFESTKAKLKAALGLMWSSELQLRLNEPEKALPIEYEILKILKEVQQMSRIYVKRIGFDPPPIKENEKRLKGDTDKMTDYTKEWETKEQIDFRETENFIEYLSSKIQHSGTTISREDILNIRKELDSIILSDPIKYFRLIELLSISFNSEVLPHEQSLELLKMLQYVVAEFSNERFAVESGTNGELRKTFLETFSRTDQ